jgi:hypothetical protein
MATSMAATATGTSDGRQRWTSAMGTSDG